MSKKEPSPSSESSKDDQAPDLSALDFGPAWARPGQSGKSNRGSNKQSGRQDDRKESFSKGKRRRQQDSQGGHRNRRDSGGRQGHRRGGKPGYGDRKERRPSISPAEGVTARIMPIEEGMDAMAKEISATGRTHSVFDLAWLVLGALDRFHIIFEGEEQLLYRCKKDHSVWLTKKECLAHFWSSEMVKNYYDEEVTEGEAPTGNFQSVARCGLSGKLIGPPNHHSYQQALLDLYHARFSNMSLDRYKSKIVMEHGEEVVEKWVEQEKQQSIWRPKSADDSKADVLVEPKEKVSEDSENQDEAQETSAGEPSEVPVEDVAVESDESTSEEVVEEKPAPIEETLPVFSNRREVEQHFLVHQFGDVFEEGKNVSTLANIPPKMISPGLMATLRNTVSEEKRYPGKLASFLCRQMSGRHLAVFKWKKRLHCGPARPKHVPDDMVMADRPAKLFHWVSDHPSGSIDKMWKDCLPDDIDDEARHMWYHDLHWLINEGLVLLFSDGTLHAAKEMKQKPQKDSKVTDEKKEAKEEVASSEEGTDKTSAPEAAADTKVDESAETPETKDT